MKIFIERKNKTVHFEAINEDGLKVNMDGGIPIGGEGKGVRPMEMLIMGLGGCSGIDISLILSKMRQEPDSIKMDIEGRRIQGVEPSLFESIQMNIYLEGNLKAISVLKAVNLSIQKYCSVAIILSRSSKIKYNVFLNNERIGDGESN